MNDAVHQRCYHHYKREAVVRCPECRRYFCRECVTEHHHRMLCTTCLNQLTLKKEIDSGAWGRRLLMTAQTVCGFILIWYVFYLVGLMLLSIPHPFHEGTIWGSQLWRVK